MWSISFLLLHNTKVNIYMFVLGSTEALNGVAIVAPPQNASVVLGRPAVMECMAQGQPKPLVSWSRQGNAGKCSYSLFFPLGFPSCLFFLFYGICRTSIICASLSGYKSLTHKEKTSRRQDTDLCILWLQSCCFIDDRCLLLN